jgi:hypothetical protein
VTHSQLPVQLLIEQAEKLQAERPLRKVRPAWVNDLVNEVAELFDPLSGVARVGYECRLGDSCWEISMFLGKEEFVGGPRDGEFRYVNFNFNLEGLRRFFSRVDRVQWSALPEAADDSKTPASLVSIEGAIETDDVRFAIYSIPPREAGIGLKHHSDGHLEPT